MISSKPGRAKRRIGEDRFRQRPCIVQKRELVLREREEIIAGVPETELPDKNQLG